MDLRCLIVAGVVGGVMSCCDGGVVGEWNRLLLDSVAATNTAPPAASRMMAMVHCAQFEAVNSINRNYRCYDQYFPTSANTDADAAAAQAARDTLVHLFPARQAIFDARLAADLGAIANGAAKSNGIALGQASAASMLAARSSDNSSMSIVHNGGTAPGQWRPTPSGFQSAALPHWRYVTPFVVNSAQQFMAPPPPSLSSNEYATAFDEVRRLGSASSAERTPYQTDTAFLWRAGGNTVTPPGQWCQVAQQLADTQGLNTEQSARLFALLGMAVADAGITAWETKNTYDFWRPINGIQLAGTDGNDLTVADPSWQPLFNTPNHQSYTSGHSTFSSSAAALLAAFFGTDNLGFTVTGDGRSRPYTSFSAAAADAGMSRIYGGIHWQFDNTAGLQSGGAIGSWVFDNAFQVPAPGVLGLLTAGLLAAGRRRR